MLVTLRVPPSLEDAAREDTVDCISAQQQQQQPCVVEVLLQVSKEAVQSGVGGRRAGPGAASSWRKPVGVTVSIGLCNS